MMASTTTRLSPLHRLRMWSHSAVARLRSDTAQDSFEYLLVIGGIVIALFLGLLAFDAVVVQMLGASCPSIDTAQGVAATAGSCVQ